MMKTRSTAILMILSGSLLVPTPVPAQARRGSTGGAETQGPKVVSARPANSRRVRTSVTGLLGWRVGLAAGAFSQATFVETASKADMLGLGFVEGASTQKVSPEISKNLDYNLAPNELAAVKERLDELNVRMPVYQARAIPQDESSRRKLFDFAKSLEVETIVASIDTASVPALEKLAVEFGVNVALESGQNPKSVGIALAGRGERIAVHGDLGHWMQGGVKPEDAVSLFKNRIIVLTLRDRSAMGTAGRDVTLGSGVANVGAVLLEMSRLQPPEAAKWLPDCGNCSSPRAEGRPLFLALDTTGDPDTFNDLARSIEAFEKAVRPAMGWRVNEVSRKMPITPTNRVSPEDRQKIEAALPRQAPAKPKKPRKLLVIDLCPTGGYYHTNIAHTNLALELMAKYTGAYEPVFDNNLDNLKYPKIKEFDAVFLNSVVGEVFIDPEVLEGLLRFVREGGGVAGVHGTTYASMDVPEFGDLMGAQDGPHRVEQATLRIEDTSSPLNASFGGKDTFVYTDEFYRFLADGPYSREKLRVLLSIDAGTTDMRGRRSLYLRPDHDYGLSWIKSYGNGRVFNCALGHTTTMFMTTPLAQHVLAGIQFVLGDLEADTTPSAKLGTRK